jgi:hypothetical protein
MSKRVKYPPDAIRAVIAESERRRREAQDYPPKPLADLPVEQAQPATRYRDAARMGKLGVSQPELDLVAGPTRPLLAPDHPDRMDRGHRCLRLKGWLLSLNTKAA